MTSMAFLNGDHGDEQASALPGWSSLRERVQLYLESQGIPLPQAERFSHEIVVLCARDTEASSAGTMDERAHREAETMLEGWHAARRATLLETT